MQNCREVQVLKFAEDINPISLIINHVQNPTFGSDFFDYNILTLKLTFAFCNKAGTT